MSMIEKPDKPPKLVPCSWIKAKRWFYFDDGESYLVLYSFADRTFLSPVDSSAPTPPPRFQDPSSWVNIFHQTAGYACHHVHIYARFLKPRKKILPLLKDLREKYDESLLSNPVPLSAALEYQSLLSRYGLGANRDYIHLQEGFYPIDIDFLKKVTAEKFPSDLQELVAKKKKSRSRWSFLDRRTFGLAVLGPNCD